MLSGSASADASVRKNIKLNGIININGGEKRAMSKSNWKYFNAKRIMCIDSYMRKVYIVHCTYKAHNRPTDHRPWIVDHK